ncbi:TcaA 3rd/4th domain-containing protein [Viridibacillus soli]|nr:hypothetical protein [Viridibacillus soli]
MSKKKKYGLFTALSVLLVLIVTHFIVKNTLAPEKHIAKMQNAFVQEDASEFLKQFSIPDGTSSNAKGFFEYVDDYGWSNLRGQLTAAIQTIEDGNLPDTIEDKDGNKLISVVDHKILGGLYHKLQFKIHATNVKVESELTDVKFAVDDYNVKTSIDKAINVGKFIPGNYKWEASINNPYGKGSYSGTMKVHPETDNTYNFTPKINAAMVYIMSDLDSSIVFVNNKSTKRTVAEFAELGGIGPIPLDKSVQIHSVGKNDSGKSIKSAIVKVDSPEIELPFESIQQARAEEERQNALSSIADNYRSDLENYYARFREEYETDFNNHEFYELEDYISPSNTKLIAEFKEYMYKFSGEDSIFLGPDTILSIKAISSNKFELVARENGEFTSGEDYETESLETKIQKYVISIDNEDYFIIESRDKLQ